MTSPFTLMKGDYFTGLTRYRIIRWLRVQDRLLSKTAVSELAESVLQRISKVIGGGAYSRYSPYGFWQEDVRALGFLRPAWGLAYDRIFQGSWSTGN